jgi:hypothetical protein
MDDQDFWNPTDKIQQALLDVKNLVYNPCGFKCSQPIMEPESAEYGACIFQLNDLESNPMELPHQILAEPYVNLSIHTAPIRQTLQASLFSSVQTM